jgi:hypothetical protein
MPTQRFALFPGVSREIASTVQGVFLPFFPLLENRQGIPPSLMLPILPVQGQWHVRMPSFPSAGLIFMMNRFGRQSTIPSSSLFGKKYFFTGFSCRYPLKPHFRYPPGDILARDKEKVLSVKFNREAFEKKEKELGQKAGRAVQSLEEKLSSIDMKALEADMKKRPLLYLAVAFSAGVALGAAIGCARRRD